MSAQFFIPNPIYAMRPSLPAGFAARASRKRRLTGALAGFGVGGGLRWKLFFLVRRLAEIPEILKTRLHPPKTTAPRPTLPRHEHT